MQRTIDDSLIAELKSTIVPDGKQYISIYDDKVTGFIVRKSVNGVVTYAIEFKDYANNRKTIKIGNFKMKPVVARNVASSLLKQKLKDRRLKSLNKEDLVEVEVKKEVIAIAEKDVANIASSFFDNKQKEGIVIKVLEEKPESFDVVIPNEEYESNNKKDDSNILPIVPENNKQQGEEIFKEQLDPFSKASFELKYIGGDNDNKFRTDILYKIDKDKLDFVSKKYISIFEENKDNYPSHQVGRAVTVANKFLLSFVNNENAIDNSEKNNIIEKETKKEHFTVDEKEKMIQARF